MAVFAGQGVEIGVGRIEHVFARIALDGRSRRLALGLVLPLLGRRRGRQVVDQHVPRLLQQLHRLGRDIGIDQLLHFRDHPPIDLQPDRHQGRVALDVQHRLGGDLAGQRVGGDDPERRHRDRPAPQRAFAQVEPGGVLGEPDLLGELQARAVLADQGVHVAIEETDQAGAIAGLHPRRIPGLLVPGPGCRRLGVCSARHRAARQGRRRGDRQEPCGLHRPFLPIPIF